MRSLIIGTLVFGIWASFARYYYVCLIKNNCGEKQEVVADPPSDAREKTLSLQLEENRILENYDEFYFKQGISKPTLNANNDAFLDSLASYLFEHEKTKDLKITGRFLTSEKDIKPGIFDNLGLARADAIRNLLDGYGIDKERISLDYEPAEGDVLNNPISFKIIDKEDNSELEQVQFTFTNMTFTESNFELNSDVFTPQSSFEMYADSMATFFEFNDDKTLTIIGHTDNLGADEYNVDLGLRRAKSAKAYLEDTIGIEVDIKVETMGEKQPMATNNTDAGRAKNRRVNFKIE